MYAFLKIQKSWVVFHFPFITFSLGLLAYLEFCISAKRNMETPPFPHIFVALITVENAVGLILGTCHSHV